MYSKFYISEGYDLVYRMKGGVIEGSNRVDFVNADTIYFMEKAPQRLWTTVYPEKIKPYRYIRYKGRQEVI